MDEARIRAGAQSLAAEVRDAEDREKRRSWRKVTTVLARLGVSRLTPAVRVAVGTALLDAGLECEPSMAVVSRSATVRLASLATVPNTERTNAVTERSERAITGLQTVRRISKWSGGTLPRDLQAGDSTMTGPGEILLIDVNPSASTDDAFKELRSICGIELTDTMIEDLLEADERAKVRIEPDWHARMVSTLGVSVRDEAGDGPMDSDIDASGSKAGTVFFEIVEFVVGRDWLLTCWHDAAKLPPSGPWSGGPSSLRDDVMPRVAGQWPMSGVTSAAGLATMIGTEMSATHISAQDEMAQWLESWETDVAHASEPETATLDSLRRALREYRVRLQAQDLSRSTAPDESWFAAEDAHHREQRMRSMVDQALKGVASLAMSVRGGVELITMSQMRKQLVYANETQNKAEAARKFAEREADRTTRFQNILTILGAVLLGPGLIAGIYGANVDLPGRDRLEGSLILLAAMAAVSALSIYVVLRLQRRGSEGATDAGGRHSADQNAAPS